MAEPLIDITVCWSLKAREVHEQTLHLPQGSTLEAAVDACLALCQSSESVFKGTDLGQIKFMQAGIWGRKAEWTEILSPGDRVELYRPLQVDPKVARRQRFKRQGKGRTGLFANRKSGSAAGY